MADSPLSSDLELEASPPRYVSRQRPTSRAQSTSFSRTSCHFKMSSAAEKDALRHHEALEKRFDKAQQASSSAPKDPSRSSVSLALDPMASIGQPTSLSGTAPALACPLVFCRRVSSSMPDVSSVGLPVAFPSSHPTATFTPSVAGRQVQEHQLPEPQMDFQAMFSSAFSSWLAVGMHQASQMPLPSLPPPSLLQGPDQRRSCSPARAYSDSSEEIIQGEEAPEDIEFSEDECLLPLPSLGCSGLRYSSHFCTRCDRPSPWGLWTCYQAPPRRPPALTMHCSVLLNRIKTSSHAHNCFWMSYKLHGPNQLL